MGARVKTTPSATEARHLVVGTERHAPAVTTGPDRRPVIDVTVVRPAMTTLRPGPRCRYRGNAVRDRPKIQISTLDDRLLLKR